MRACVEQDRCLQNNGCCNRWLKCGGYTYFLCTIGAINLCHVMLSGLETFFYLLSASVLTFRKYPTHSVRLFGAKVLRANIQLR